MAPSDPPAWSWKSPSHPSAAHGLRYQPGNWGDILKGCWALHVVDAIIATKGASASPLRCLDPFAGAVSYPLEPAARQRLHDVREPPLTESQEEFSRAGRLASTASLILARCRQKGRAAELHIFDTDTNRRDSWQEAAGSHVLDVASCDEALTSAAQGAEFDLILIDPYDFFDRWGLWLRSAIRLARRSLVLVYLYNKSPRSTGHLHQYRRCIDELRSAALKGTAIVIGRLPADATLPRAYHEVMLLGSARAVTTLREDLQRLTSRLFAHVAVPGSFEAFEGAGELVDDDAPG